MPVDERVSSDDALGRRVKAELRKRMGGLRKALPASACAQRSARIVARLSSLELLAHAHAVALFWPMEDRHEVDLRAFDADLRGRGARVAYPALDPGSGGMSFRFVADPDAMKPAWNGLREPSLNDPEALPSEIDAIVVPALAVDPRGHRIGYGAGHYDRALVRYAPPAVAIAVAFDFQLMAEIPRTEGDVAVAWIVTDARCVPAETSA